MRTRKPQHKIPIRSDVGWPSLPLRTTAVLSIFRSQVLTLLPVRQICLRDRNMNGGRPKKRFANRKMEPPPDPPTLRWEAIVAVRSFSHALGLKLPRDCRWIGARSGKQLF